MELTFKIPGSIPGKARPRVTRNGTYMPPKYVEFKVSSRKFLPKVSQPLTPPISIKIALIGSHKSDLDNIAGTILDILVDQGILDNDSSKQVPDIHITRFESSKEKFAQVTLSEISKFTYKDYLKAV
ncbi:endodeoxyribonuclease RusA [Calothrix sp. NIES-2100]|uniref:RusA family crossover junction endodeoxyribonuclease n=1 Tax=Calothrix sp. NIES-2100 TaxID=1954172 RepID=UPI000B5FB78D|nr:endodeoxyribonuclease RusA [Calothrix sp. NIES-2100]